MSLLREYIRELLTEAAMGPADLPDDVFVTIEEKDGYEVYFSDESGKRITGKTSPLYGYVAMDQAHRGRGLGHCLGAFMVVGSEATHGWGPMLYDVIIELAGSNGVMPDRQSLSKEAYNIWQYYMNSRPDVVKKQLDDERNTLTPDEEDNCDMDTAIQRSGLTTKDLFSSEWSDEDTAELLKDSPIMKVYTKGPTTIQQLEAMGRLIRL